MSEIAFDELKILGEISRGAGNTLYKGVMPDGTEVAIKKARVTGADVLQRFSREADILSRVSHPNVIPLLAVSKSAPNYVFSLKLCPRGSLEDVLHVEGTRLPWNTVRHIAIQLARGLSYLHSLSILHRDLKSSNCLVYTEGEDEFHIYISDFDTAEFEEVSQQQELESGRTRKNRTVGSLVTMAPEILRNTGVGTGKGFVFSRGSDVYSLGITMNEICAATMPYSDRFTAAVNMHTVLDMNYSKHTLAAAIIRENLRPVLASTCPEGFKTLVQSCWADEVGSRPSADAVQTQLESLELGDFGTAPVVSRSGGISAANLGAPLATNYFLRTQGDDDGLKQLAGALEEAHTELAHARGPFWIFIEKMAAAGKIEGFDPANLPSDYRPVVTAGAFETCGRRGPESMEDAHAIVLNMFGRDDQHLIACFDGHGGPWASKFAAEFLPLQVIHSWSSVDSPPAAVIEAFLRTDETFSAFGPESCGTTAIAAFVSGSRLVIVNAGDCRAILCRGDDTIQLSRDHTASDENERSRIEAAGGTIEETADGPRVCGGIRVTRALGDKRFKPYVIPQPEVMMLELEPDDHFIVLACDGVFDVMKNDEIVRLVKDTVKDASLAAKRIVLEAYQRSSSDNLTCVVAFLRPVSTFEKVV